MCAWRVFAFQGSGEGEEDVYVSSPNQPMLPWGADLFLLDALFGSDSPLTAQSQFRGAFRPSCTQPPPPRSAPTPGEPFTWRHWWELEPRGVVGGSRHFGAC